MSELTILSGRLHTLTSLRIPDTDTSGPLQHLTRVLDSMRSAKEVKEAKGEMERVKPELDRWSEEQTVLQQQIDDQLRALDDFNESDVQKVKERLEAVDEILKVPRLGTPDDVRARILRHCLLLTDMAARCDDALEPCYSEDVPSLERWRGCSHGLSSPRRGGPHSSAVRLWRENEA